MPYRFLLLALLLPLQIRAAGPATVLPTPGGPSSFFGLNKLWEIHLDISAEDWAAMQPKGGGFGTPPRAGKPDPGKIRSQFGYEFTYVKARLTIGGTTFENIGLRFKGNSTYATTARVLKRPFKIELDKYVPGQHFRGVRKLSLNVHVMDPTQAREALGYALYREAGVPAPRTAFGFLTISVPGKHDKEVAGVYTIIENIDKPFLKDRFGSSKGLLLKPERVGPLDHLGEKWPPYEERYRPRTPATKHAQDRLITLTKLVQQPDDARFHREIGKLLDVDSFLRYTAATVLMSSLDSFIGLPHNYYLYLDPARDRFVIMPWDLDHAFGGLMMFSSAQQLMELSVRQPWLGRNPLVKRLLDHPARYAAYREHLESLLMDSFRTKRMQADMKAITALLAPWREKEKAAVSKRGDAWSMVPLALMFPSAPAIDVFTEQRIRSVRAQLAGTSKGVVLTDRFRGMGRQPPPLPTQAILKAIDTDKDGKISRAEASAGVEAMFKACDKDGKGILDEKTLAAGLEKLWPRPGLFGRASPGLARSMAKGILQKAGKDGKLERKPLLEASDKLFTEMDATGTGKVDIGKLEQALRTVMPPHVPFGPDARVEGRP